MKKKEETTDYTTRPKAATKKNGTTDYTDYTDFFIFSSCNSCVSWTKLDFKWQVR